MRHQAAYRRINPDLDRPISEATMVRIVYNAHQVLFGGRISIRKRHGLRHTEEAGEEIISAEHGFTVSQLIEIYNDAVELNWSLRNEIRNLKEDLESYRQAVDKLIGQLYG